MDFPSLPNFKEKNATEMETQKGVGGVAQKVPEIVGIRTSMEPKCDLQA